MRKNNNKYCASIKVDNKNINLGSFDTIEEAAEVRTEAEVKYFGEFRYDLSDKDIIDEENMEQYTEYKQCI